MLTSELNFVNGKPASANVNKHFTILFSIGVSKQVFGPIFLVAGYNPLALLFKVVFGTLNLFAASRTEMLLFRTSAIASVICCSEYSKRGPGLLVFTPLFVFRFVETFFFFFVVPFL